jgi:hypothetical protein
MDARDRTSIDTVGDAFADVGNNRMRHRGSLGMKEEEGGRAMPRFARKEENLLTSGSPKIYCIVPVP